jgi:hypothetical protein
MTVFNRSRDRFNEPEEQGSYTDLVTHVEHKQSITSDWYDHCDDVIGDYGRDHDLNVWHHNSVICRISGAGYYYEYNRFGVTHNPVSDLGSFRNTGAVAQDAAARTNPSRPHVNLPNYLFELRDTAELLYIAGRNLIQKSASYYLSYQFGWKPLIQDVLAFLTLHDAAERRSDELRRLSSSRGLRRRVDLGHDTFESSGSREQLESFLFGMWGTPHIETDIHYWAVCDWRPSTWYEGLTNAEKSQQMRRQLIGIDSSQILLEVWESLPWSWLFDWCSDISGWMIANNNSVAHLSHAVLVMVEQKTKRKWKDLSFSGFPNGKPEAIDPTNPEQVSHRKFRRLAYPTLTATIPFLTGRQLSILGSLAVTRLRLNL